MIPIDAKQFSDSELIELVHSFDRQGLPTTKRVNGDDKAIKDLVNKHQISITVANIALMMTVILREATIRGIVIKQLSED